ncbi:MAG: OsmC family protein, partial [Acidimicrobiales bacterium]
SSAGATVEHSSAGATVEHSSEGATVEHSSEQLERLVRDAVDASPAFASMREPVANTFAIYVNGRRRAVNTMRPSPAADAPDPFLSYSAAPAPVEADAYLPDLIHKTGQKSDGRSEVAPGDMKTKQIRPVYGRSRMPGPSGVTEVDVVLGIPGASHFAMRTDERTTDDRAPCGLSLLSAGIAFCYMTQLSRYIEYQKMAIRAVRLVQDIPYTIRADGDRWIGGLEPADTHLFLSGDEDDETFERLMRIAERTCYLHSTLSGSLPPTISVTRK